MASESADKLKEARERAATGREPLPGKASLEQVEEEQQAEFHGPTTAMLDSMQPFNIEGGEGMVHHMQARHAKAAMGQAFREAGQHLLGVADVRPLIRQHPWAAIGGAAALGFVAAALVVPSEKQRAASRLRALERALQDEAAMGARDFRSKAKSGSRLLRLGWRLARPTLLSMVSGALTGAATGAATGADAGADSGQEAAAGGGAAGHDPGISPEPSYGPVADVT